MTKHSKHGAMTTILMLLGSLIAGCSGGGEPDAVLGGGGGSTLYAPRFQADEPAPGANTVSMNQAVAQGDAVTVAIGVTGTDNVHSASLEVTFDQNRLAFVDWSCGDLLPPCGGSTLAFVTPLPGRLVIGIAQTGSGPGVDVSETATLVRLTFRAIGPGPSRLEFDPNRTALGDPDLQDLPGIEWFGGLVLTD